MNTIMIIILIVMGAAVLLSFTVLLGKTRSVEKMVALDVITTITTAGLLLLSLILKQSFILDIAIVYALLSFGAVLVVARFTEKGV